MSHSDWREYTPVLVIFIVIVGLASISIYEDYQDTERAYHAAEQKYEKTKNVVPLGTSPKGDYTDPKSARDEWRAEYDLKAQRDMARSTNVIMWFTIFGVMLLGGTLWEARNTTTAAIEAANSSREAVRIAEQTLQATERPWVSVTPKIASSVVFKGGEGRVSIAFVLKNFGKSPAVNAEVFFEIVDIRNEFKTLREIRNRAKRRRPRDLLGHKIFPTDQFTEKVSSPISKQVVRHIEELVGEPVDDYKLTISVVGCVVYNSPAGTENHTTEFMFWIGREDPSNPNIVIGMPTTDGEIPLDELQAVVGFGTGRAD